jgi:hypothetical protein
MRGLFRKILVSGVVLSAVAYAQNIGVGLRGGIPLTDFIEADSKTGALTNVVTGKGNVIIGPMVDVRLPFGLGIEFDALYRRWNATGALSRGSASTWEFPLYGKLRAPGILFRPYAGAGMNFQRLGELRQFIAGGTVDKSRRGFLGAGGIDFKLPKVHIAPEVRFTRWNSSGPVRSTNQVDFLIGVSF